jgi:2-succinyl-6-hydroxy-2,4-cyclohexadiene-1-carboxylate synthase
MGGRVALRLAHLLGHRLRGLVLISASPGIEDPVDRAERIAQDYALAGRIEEEGMDWFRAHWAEVPIIRSQANIPSEVYGAMQERRKQNRPVGLAGSLRGMGQGAVDPVWAQLGQLQVPTLVISGADDQSYTEIARKTVAGMTQATHVCIPNAGHCTHLEAIGSTVDAVQSFLSSIG